MDKARDTFIFYRSFKESIKDLDDKDKLTMYEAISDYALDMEEPELSGFPKALFSLIKPQLDANWRRYQNGVKGGEHGHKGGAPKGNKNAKKGKETTPNQPQDNGKTTPNKNTNKNTNLNNHIYPFEKFWNEYDCKVGRAEAIKKWEKLTPLEITKIKDHVPAYVSSTPEKEYRKHPVTYLNQKTWKDEIIVRNGSKNGNEKHPANEVLGNDLYKEQLSKF
jgi:hypothetical protein